MVYRAFIVGKQSKSVRRRVRGRCFRPTLRVMKNCEPLVPGP